MWIEVLGVLATVLVFIGFLYSSKKWIRIFNSIGSALFVIYGLYLHAFSVWLLNGACLILNLYKLYKEKSEFKES